MKFQMYVTTSAACLDTYCADGGKGGDGRPIPYPTAETSIMENHAMKCSEL